MSIWAWLGWAILLIAQNFAFTFVSRARNSGSIRRHAIASVFSNGIWFVQFFFVVSAFMAILSGKFGWMMALAAALWYTLWTMSGSLLAHWHALKTEKGKNAVGASKKYAQIPIDDWKEVKRQLNME